MRIRSVKVAQAVRLDGKMWTNLSVDDPSAPKDLELNWNDGLLYASARNEVIIITGNNCAYMDILDIKSNQKKKK